MKLQATRDITTGYGSYSQGQVFDVPDETAKVLLRSNPNSLVVYEELATEVKAPDRRMRGGRKR